MTVYTKPEMYILDLSRNKLFNNIKALN